MKHDLCVQALTLLLATFSGLGVATAQQAKPTATQDIQLSVFSGVSGVYTGLSNSRNLSVTAGLDLALSPRQGMRPILEVRGTEPFNKGSTVAQKDFLAGLRLDLLLGRRLHPYGDFLFGRGEMKYANGGYNFNNSTYLESTSYVYSPGAGFDFDLTTHFVIKLDGQYQIWDGPTASGKVHPAIGTFGLVYHIGWLGMP
ncbi:MAG TPA: hypothetical protein VMQ60_06300 [Acidobacteriaceae bacterium]|jgi:hypothetical protein|nr:hypothetical protein [Acidobacteriaceae bacterium]